MNVLYGFDEGDTEVQTGIHLTMKLLETMHKAGVLFSHEYSESEIYDAPLNQISIQSRLRT